MAKQKHEQAPPVEGGELLDLRIQLVGHVVWPNMYGKVEVQYKDGSIRVRTDQHFHAKAAPNEYKVCLFRNRNIFIKPI